MTTQRQIKKLATPLLERNSDLALIGWLIVLKPVHHFARGIVIDRTSSADIFRPRSAMLHMFGRFSHFALNYGERIYRNGPNIPGSWRWSEADVAGAFADRIEREVLPWLRSFKLLDDYCAYALPTDPSKLVYYNGLQTLFSLALGDLDKARDLMIADSAGEWIKFLNEKNSGLGDELKNVGSGLPREKRLFLASLLHEWEEYSVEKLKLGAVWESTPFALEREAGYARNRTNR